jgi:hypothetical protein
MPKASLIERLYSQPAMYETVRAVGYDGIREAELAKKLEPLKEKYGMAVINALHELTLERDGFFTLRPDVRKMCGQLLGPAPEHPRRDEILHAPILYTEAELRSWREKFEAEKTTEAEPKKRTRKVRNR